MIVGPDGKEVKSQRHSPCPNCGRDPKEFIQSGGFGEVYLVCPCGKEFKDLKCQTLSIV